MSVQYLLWRGSFRYPGMVVLAVPADGSCLLHSLLLAFDQSYRLEKRNGSYISRSNIVKSFRQELANFLAAPVDPLDPQSRSYYDLLANGTLREAAQVQPEYSLTNMQNQLRHSQKFISYPYLEFIANILNKDIYILSGQHHDVYMTTAEDLYQKGRPSIVLYFEHSHFQLVGIKEAEGDIKTLFFSDDYFVQTIRKRQDELRR